MTSVGVCSVTANQAGNASWGAAPEVTRSLGLPAEQVIAFSELPVDARVGTTATLVATASSGLPVTFRAGGGGCRVSGNRVAFITTEPCLVTASQSGSAAWLPALPVMRATAALPGTQVITFSLPTVGRDGWDLTLSGAASSGLTVTYSAAGACVVTGTSLHLAGSGACAVTASQAGDAHWAAAPDVMRTMNVTAPDPQRADQTIDFPPLPTTAAVGAGVSLTATASSGLAVTYTAAGGCRVSGGRILLAGVGTCSVTAAQPGSAAWNAATPITRTIDITPADQTIGFSLPVPLPPIGTPFTVSATASSGLPVSFAVSGACVSSAPDGSTVTMTVPGTCDVTAFQPGNADYRPAVPVTRSATLRGAQTIAFLALPVAPAVGSIHALVATATSGLPVSFTAGGSCLMVNSSSVRFVGVGDCVVTATQDGNTSWNAAVPVTNSTVAGPGDQAISFTLPVPLPPTGTSFTVSATATSGLAVTFAAAGACSSSGPDGSTITMNAPGTCSVTASQPGDADYRAAPGVVRSGILKGDQTITFAALPVDPPVGSTIDLAATAAPSLLAVTFSASGGCALVGASRLSFVAAEDCVVTADQGGDAFWNAASPVVRSTEPRRGNQTITLTLPSSLPTEGGTFIVAAKASSGLPVTISVSGACTNSAGGPVITAVGAGTCQVTASQPGNAAWNPAPDVVRSPTLRASQTITFPALPASPTVGDTFALTATASSGLAVGYLVSGGCTLISSAPPMIRFAGSATCRVIASQGGNADYVAAPTVTRSTTAARGTQTLTWTLTVPPSSTQGSSFSVAATSSAGLVPVTFTTTGPCTASGTNGSRITSTGGGVCVITATQAGNADYQGASIQASTTIRAVPSITITAPVGPVKLGSLITVTATSSGGGAVTLEASDACTRDSGQVLIDALGSCTIRASVPGDATWAASTVTRTVAVRQPTVTTIAGAPGQMDVVDGVGSSARFVFPDGIAVEGNGDLFVTDPWSATIRQVTAGGVVTTYAGAWSYQPSLTDGPRTGAARFVQPLSVDLDGAGGITVSDWCSIRRISSSGQVTTEVTPKFDSASRCTGADGARTSAGFVEPSGSAVGPDGNRYFVDAGACRVRKLTTSAVSTVAGGSACAQGLDGTGSVARFLHPRDIEWDPWSSSFYVADLDSVRRVTTGGKVTTVSGGWSTHSMAVDANGNVMIGGWGGVGFLSRNGKFSVLTQSRPFADGSLQTAAGFTSPGGSWIGDIELLPGGDFVIGNANTIRRITL